MSANFCSSCGVSLQGGANFCPNCGGKLTTPPQPPQSASNSSPLVLGLLSLMLVSVAAFWFFQNKTTPVEPDTVRITEPFAPRTPASQPVSAPEPSLPVEISDAYGTIFQSFRENQTGAVEKYKGRLLKVRGTVAAVLPYGVMVSPDGVSQQGAMTIDISLKDLSKLGKLSLGQRVSGYGFVRAGTYLNIAGPEVMVGLINGEIF